MVPQCYMLCLYVYGLKQYGQPNNSCSLCVLFFVVVLFVLFCNFEYKIS